VVLLHPRATTPTVFTVHAIAVEHLGPDANATAAVVGFTMFGKVLARALLVPIYEQ
jgi:phosphatidylethanolamine-binding protein (PEBP) family uncharacterized protein